jgi:hypothetical protein
VNFTEPYPSVSIPLLEWLIHLETSPFSFSSVFICMFICMFVWLRVQCFESSVNKDFQKGTDALIQRKAIKVVQSPNLKWSALETLTSTSHRQGQGILKVDGTVDFLFDWFGISCITNDNFCFYFQNRLIHTSQRGDQCYSDTSPFSIPWQGLFG